MESKNELQKVTLHLISLMDRANDHFFEIKSSGEMPDFYKEVKPFTEEVKQTVEVWEDVAKKWVNESSRKTIYPQQVDVTAKNINMVALQSFYPSTSRVNFINLIKSVKYVLRLLLTELET